MKGAASIKQLELMLHYLFKPEPDPDVVRKLLDSYTAAAERRQALREQHLAVVKAISAEVRTAEIESTFRSRIGAKKIASDAALQKKVIVR